MNVGDTAPDFELADQNGTLRKLSAELANGPVVLFFYPAAMTSGCTAESCHFRDLKTEFTKAGAQRLGISMDSVAKQKQFSDMHSFDYPLLSDESGSVSEAFGVRRKLLAKLAPVKRSTFVIGQDRKIIEVISSETKMAVHADKALAALTR